MSASKQLSECPICFDPWKDVERIFLCDTGHSICSSCTPQIAKCPICQKAMTSKRNFDLESVIKSLQIVEEKTSVDIKCCFAHKGCKYTFKKEEGRSTHEAECRHKIFPCPETTYCKIPCPWNGTSLELFQHFQTAHGKHSALSFKGELRFKQIKLEKQFSQVMVANAFSGSYIILFKMDPHKKMAYLIISFIGPNKYAIKYSYELEIFSGATRKFKVNEICRSNSDSVQDIINSGQCMVIPYSVLKSHLSPVQELLCRFRIINTKADD